MVGGDGQWVRETAVLRGDGREGRRNGRIVGQGARDHLVCVCEGREGVSMHVCRGSGGENELSSRYKNNRHWLVFYVI